ncbi:MAG: hypothetical protein LBE18_07205 [Planctomycetaceae bacterium]|jgi:hypothetical protein|nr:hypothetical protein [Planctomycetaceae bacterium]
MPITHLLKITIESLDPTAKKLLRQVRIIPRKFEMQIILFNSPVCEY